MSTGITRLASPARAGTQTPCRNFDSGSAPTEGQIVVGIVAACGWGLFSGAFGSWDFSTSGWATFNTTWPIVYTTLTETWAWSGTIGTGSASATNIWDTAFSSPDGISLYYPQNTYATSGADSPPDYGGGWSGVVTGNTGTSLTATITYNDGMGGTATGTYTAVLSNPIASYATLAAAAVALLSETTIPALSNSVGGFSGWTVGQTIVYGISQSPSYFVGAVTRCGSGDGGDWVAASYGLPLLCAADGSFWSNQADITELGGTSAPGLSDGNYGFVAATTSTYGLYGASPMAGASTWPVSSSPPAWTAHGQIYAQPINLPGGVPTLGAVTPATSIASSSTTLGPGGAVPPQPCSLTFAYTDAPAAAGTTYGLLGFRTPAA
jgi:hypothetical protein